jgi:adenosylcobinamide-GDP ribazoletransferase
VIGNVWFDFLAAVQFLTRIPLPALAYQENSLARAVKFFPIVGLLLGAGSAGLYFALTPHLPPLVVSLLIVAFLVPLTGCLHEDGLADSVDGFGGGWDRERVLEIMRDSRIGSYGAAALVLSLGARIFLISSLPRAQAAAFLMAAPVLSRWSSLPLSFFLPSAREIDQEAGQGARIARLTSRGSLFVGSLIAFAILFALLRLHALLPISAAIGVTLLTGLYYRRRIGGITGDCFGATNQLSEIAVLLCGVWA